MAAPGNGGNGGNGRPTKSSGFPLFKKSAAPPPAAPAPNAPRPSASRLNVPPPQAPPAARRSQSPMEIESAPATSTFSFWKNSTQIAKRPVPATPAYIAWYGTLTGDIWHVAAAQILSEYIRSGSGNAHPFPDHEIRTCLTIMADKKYGTAGEAPAAASSAQQAPAAAGSHGHSQEYQYGEAAYGEEWAYGEEAQSESSKISPCVQRGRKSWKYLQAIGLNASLVMVPHRIGSGQVAHANDTLSAEEATTWYVDKPTTFDQALTTWVGHLDRRPPWPQGPGVANDPCLIDLLASTTVVMQMMEYIGYQEARRILGYRLSGGATMGGTREALALQKVYQLCGIIDAVNTNVNNTLQGVVLFNYRIGDVNKQHNASAGILNDVRKAAAAHRYATIVIPQMSSDEYRKHKPAVTTHGRSVSTPALTPYMRSVVFDLLDVDTPVQQPQQGHQPRQGSSQQPAAAAPQFMDDTAKAYFWHLVATFMQGTFSPLGTATGEPPAQLAKALQVQRPPVVGLVGGRSGSTDLPGFVGLRVYSWEEPLLGALHGAEKTTSSGAWSSTYYNIQGPQATRLFNQQPIIATGWLSMEGFVKKGKSREYTNLNVSDGFLNEWLGGGEVGIPRLPDDASKKFLEVRKPASTVIIWLFSFLTNLCGRTFSGKTWPRSQQRRIRRQAPRHRPAQAAY